MYQELKLKNIFFDRLLQQLQELEVTASRRANIVIWVCLVLMSVQFSSLARLTWWEYSWDIMEPITYFVTYGTTMLWFIYFVLTRQVNNSKSTRTIANDLVKAKYQKM